jgi:hypothetical protein
MGSGETVWRKRGEPRLTSFPNPRSNQDILYKTGKVLLKAIFMNPHTRTGIRAIENFTRTTNPGEQRSLSPISKVMTPTQATPFVPMYIIQSQNDGTVPYHNLVDLICAFQSKNVSPNLYQTLVLWGSDLHSFYCWNSCDNPEGATPHAHWSVLV